MLLSTVNPKINLYSSHLSSRNAITDDILKHNQSSRSYFSSHLNHKSLIKRLPCVASSKNSNSNSDHDTKSKTRSQNKKINVQKKDKENPEVIFPTTIPKKPRRGRKSEAAACEDIIRNSLEQTFASIREQNSETEDYKEKIMKDRVDEERDSDDRDSDESDSDESEDESGEKGEKREKKMVIEEESSDWPLDADVGWGIRASEFFDKHPIKNIVGEDGIEIDWEGEIDDNWVQEINCLEWESFAFHPSPLVVFVFERYNRATENWKSLKELEKAIKVYWSAKDRLPPRAVKIDINIERDLAYALKVRECPQILFLRGNKIIHREKEFRTSDELVHMIAHFYYKAKKPSWISSEAITSPI